MADETRPPEDEETPAVEETPEPAAEETPAAEAEAPAPEETPEPAAEETPEPVGEEPAADEPVVETPEPVAEAPAPEEAAQDAPAPDVPAEAAQDAPEAERGARDENYIPGADLTPDIVLDAEGQEVDPYAAEGDGEPGAEGETDADGEEVPRTIAQARIDLAAGATYKATGKRKTAVARVMLRPGTGAYTINGKPLDDFFPRITLQRNIRQPLETVGFEEKMDVIARMHGGGVSSQAGALRHGIARALLEADPNLRGELKRRGFLTRDARAKERKKAGLKKARKRPQFSKR